MNKLLGILRIRLREGNRRDPVILGAVRGECVVLALRFSPAAFSFTGGALMMASGSSPIKVALSSLGSTKSASVGWGGSGT